MRFRGLLTAAAATVTVVAGALAVPATAGAATLSAGAHAGVSASSPLSARAHSVNLHAAFTRLRGHVKTGPEMGIVLPRGVRAAAVKAAPVTGNSTVGNSGTCTEPNCDLLYNGGPVEHSPKLYVVFWGPTWQTDTAEQASGTYLLNFFQGLGTSSDTWSKSMSQYTDSNGGPAFTGSVLASYVIDPSAPPAQVQPSDIATESLAAAAYFTLSNSSDDQVIVVSQAGTCFSDGFAGSSCQPVQGAYCAWHSATTYNSNLLSFTNLPYQLDAGSLCGENFINPGTAGTWDGFSIVGGHEYAESVTDPNPGYGWYDPNDNVSGGEIGDKCAWGGQIWGSNDPAGNITLSTGTFGVQSLWSNAAGGCVMSTSPTATSVSTSLSGGGHNGASITVPSGTAVHDTAKLSGVSAVSATGTVTYTVYSDAACTKPAAAAMHVSVTNGAVPASPAVKLSGAHTYYWTAAYGGDSINAASASACGAEKESVLAPPPSIDTVASRHGGTSATAYVWTGGKGELLVAYVAGKGPSGHAQSAVVTASGLTWHLVARSNAGRGDAEVWYARAGGKLTGLHVTAKERYRGWPVQITVVTYRNASGIGRHTVAHSGKGKPSAALTTSGTYSWVFAAGDDWAASAVPTPAGGQRLITKATDSSDTYWVQATNQATPKAGTKVTIYDTKPTNHPFNLVLVEIR